MIVRRFLSWIETAGAGERAEGASALARAYLFSDLGEEGRRDAEVALTALLDDPSPLVRRAMAEALCRSQAAPHHIVLALAMDQAEIAAPVLAHSPLLTDTDLLDCAALGDGQAQAAIALRAPLPPPVAAALAEIGERDALIVMAANLQADLPEFSMRRMIERFGEEAGLRGALLARGDLPATVRHDLVVATAAALSGFVTQCAWMGQERAARMTRESRDKAAVIIATDSSGEGEADCQALAGHLRESGHLTTSLLLRALVSGHTPLIAAALSELAGMPLTRVRGLMREPASSGFAALHQRAGLAPVLLPVFRSVLGVIRARAVPPAGAVSLELVDVALEALRRWSAMGVPREGAAKVMSLLRRFEVESTRDIARAAAQSARQAVEPGLSRVDAELPQIDERMILEAA